MNRQTTFLQLDESYIIKIVDNIGNIIMDYEDIETSYEIIELNSGVGFYKPRHTGDIVLTLDEKQRFFESTSQITVQSSSDEGFDIGFIILIGFIIFLVVIGVLILLHQYHYISIPSILKKNNNFPLFPFLQISFK
jgi:hypothetical protein